MRYRPEDIKDLVDRFVWVSDGRVDSFRILSDPRGPVRGDCDDFVVTALWLCEGKDMGKLWNALISGRAAIWRCTMADGTRHAILWHRSHGWIENNGGTSTKEPAADLRLRHRRWASTIALKMTIGKLR